jgi:hypothetical protein
LFTFLDHCVISLWLLRPNAQVVALTQATLQTDGAAFLAHMPEVSARVRSCVSAGQPILQANVPSPAFTYPVQSVDGKQQAIGNVATALGNVLAALNLQLLMSDLPLPINLSALEDLVVSSEVVLAAGQVHRFRSVIIRRGGTLTTTAWDGATGGDLRLDIALMLDIEAGGSINLCGKGYGANLSRHV